MAASSVLTDSTVTRKDSTKLFKSSTFDSKDTPNFIAGNIFSVISFHVGDYYSKDPSWNYDRWNQILETIRVKNADIIILHEVNRESTAFFDRILSYEDYDKTVPYLRQQENHQHRDNWEVIYCKFPVSLTFYIPLTEQDGLSCFRCSIRNFNSTVTTVTICATTLNLKSTSEINQIKDVISNYVDIQSSLMVALSTNQYGSYLTPPRGLCDMWISIGKPEDLNSTLNLNLSSSPRSNKRADQIWIAQLIPLTMSLLKTKDASDHNGLYATCGLPLPIDSSRYSSSKSIRLTTSSRSYIDTPILSTEEKTQSSLIKRRTGEFKSLLKRRSLKTGSLISSRSHEEPRPSVSFSQDSLPSHLSGEFEFDVSPQTYRSRKSFRSSSKSCIIM
jgi:hypothetical protein